MTGSGSLGWTANTMTTLSLEVQALVVNNSQRPIRNKIVSDEVLIIFNWIFFPVLCQLVDLFGVVTNIINIICFAKQGFQDPVNISLLGLAVSDLGSLIPLLWSNICLIPAFNELDLTFEPIEVQYLSGAWPHGIFTRVTSWITAIITMERCLCIAIPLKVKTIVTPKRVTIAIVAVFIILLASICPLYYVNRYAYKYSPTRNKTIIGLVFTDNREEVERGLFTVNNVLIPGTAFVIVIVCTVTLVVKLKFKTQWRAKSIASKGSADTASIRDQRVTKMVTVISILFIICYFPLCLIVAALVAEPGLSINGQFRNMFIVVCAVSFFLESANSASNIFIYYHMSKRYRDVLHQLFFRKEKVAAKHKFIK